MSSSNYSYSSSSYSSYSSSNGGQRTGQAYQQTTTSDPSGTKVQTTSQNLGGPAIREERQYDSEGRQILEGGRVLGQGSGSTGTSSARRIEDVSDENDKNREYMERMEDEYAKREGGA